MDSLELTPAPPPPSPRAPRAWHGEGMPSPDALGEFRYGFRVAQTRLVATADTPTEVHRMPPLCPLPNAPGWVVGVFNLGGNLVPVFDLAALCSEGEEAEPPSSMLVLGSPPRVAGVPIAEMPRLVHIDRMREKPEVRPSALADHIRGAYESDGAIWLEFDADRLFRALGAGTGESPD